MTLFNESHHRSTMRHQKAIELNDLKEEKLFLENYKKTVQVENCPECGEQLNAGDEIIEEYNYP